MKNFPQDDGLKGAGTWLVLAIVMILFTLFSGSTRATPQTRDVDLKAAQVPPLVWGTPPDFHGMRSKLAGDIEPVDLRPYASAISGLDLSEVTSIAPGEYDFDNIGNVTGLASFVALLPVYDVTLHLSGCGLTDVSAILTIFNQESIDNVTFSLESNPLNGSIGGIDRANTGTGNLLLGSCGITSIGTLGNLNQTELEVTNDAITTLDLSTGACSLDAGYLIFSSNPLTTLVPGNGSTTGIVTANGGSIYFDDCPLASSQINGLLAALVAMTVNTGSVGTLNVASSGGDVPTGSGLDDIDTLVSMGWSITTN